MERRKRHRYSKSPSPAYHRSRSPSHRQRTKDRRSDRRSDRRRVGARSPDLHRRMTSKSPDLYSPLDSPELSPPGHLNRYRSPDPLQVRASGGGTHFRDGASGIGRDDVSMSSSERLKRLLEDFPSSSRSMDRSSTAGDVGMRLRRSRSRSSERRKSLLGDFHSSSKSLERSSTSGGGELYHPASPSRSPEKRDSLESRLSKFRTRSPPPGSNPYEGLHEIHRSARQRSPSPLLPYPRRRLPSPDAPHTAAVRKRSSSPARTQKPYERENYEEDLISRARALYEKEGRREFSPSRVFRNKSPPPAEGPDASKTFLSKIMTGKFIRSCIFHDS